MPQAVVSYKKGLSKANLIIEDYRKKFGKRKAQKAMESFHDQADSKMWAFKSKGSNSKYEFYRGLAMGFGSFVHTGRKLK